MPSGTVKSYSAQKSFGFIESENGEPVFFHISKVAPDDRNSIKSGCIVSFDECPTPKGMAAEKVTIAGQASECYLPPQSHDVIVSKTEACGRENRVVHKLPRFTVEDRDPDAAISLLQQKAQNAGCNALVNLKKGRRKGRAWMNTNYCFSIHIVSAEPALVKRIIHTTDLARADASKQQLEDETRKVSSANIDNRIVQDASRYSFVFGVVLLITFLLIFGIFSTK